MSIELSNKIVLLLAASLILVVFMDGQARRHYAEIAYERGSSAIRSVIPERESERNSERRNADSGDAHLHVPAQPLTERELPQPIRRSADAILTGLGDAIENATTLRHPARQSELPLRLDGPLKLYYIRFRSSSSLLVEVERSTPSGELTPLEILRILQRGPNYRERGLLNPFDESIVIHAAWREGEVVVVDLGEGVSSMGSHIIQDRIDQIVYTLTALPGIEAVELMIDGRRVRNIGYEGLDLPELLRREGRRIHPHS